MKQILSLSTFRSECISQKLFQQMRISGALLYGPPGTGKTHLARAIAKDMGMNMMAITPAAIYGKYVGETENNIKTAFSICSKMAPCILFIDEVDALFSKRSSSGARWQRACINQFLQEMDGIATGKDAPFVLTATNRPSDLDEAFLRRLPQRIQFKLPSQQARRQILINLLEGTRLHSDVSYPELVDSTEGYSGSDLKTLCVQAAIIFSSEELQNQTEHNNGDIPQSHGLERRHFIEALKRTFRTVSEKNQINSDKFANAFGSRDITDTKEDASYSSIYEESKELPLDESYVCDPCGRSFPSKADMEVHLMLMDEEACRTGITRGDGVKKRPAKPESVFIYPHDYRDGPK
ncbi:P-loop containing nucleoside triphosphate hydrolase protein [Trichoderma sp. SZMC 28012]